MDYFLHFRFIPRKYASNDLGEVLTVLDRNKKFDNEIKRMWRESRLPNGGQKGRAKRSLTERASSSRAQRPSTAASSEQVPKEQ